MEFFLCCGSGYSGSGAQQHPLEKSRLLVATEAHPCVGRKRGGAAGERRCGVIDWRPSLSSILENNVLSERVFNGGRSSGDLMGRVVASSISSRIAYIFSNYVDPIHIMELFTI
ncbi:unnamed protein product [Fraxinus pennsylvanica]|uniref:Uncharacterized protein n=1 Tax=Fraxinus pennsylvanica TaxID=56036 RepID=A0AAD1YSV9_9LAMI|nr:unnamed protein product [Fraxinus pennsylvanica]